MFKLAKITVISLLPYAITSKYTIVVEHVDNFTFKVIRHINVYAITKNMTELNYNLSHTPAKSRYFSFTLAKLVSRISLPVKVAAGVKSAVF